MSGGLKNNQVLLKLISSLEDEFKLLTNLKKEVQAKQEELKRMSFNANMRASKQESLIMQIAILAQKLKTGYGQEEFGLNADQIFLEDSPAETSKKTLRADISGLVQLIRFSYCVTNFDTISDTELSQVKILGSKHGSFSALQATLQKEEQAKMIEEKYVPKK